MFSLIWWGFGCSLGVRKFDPRPYVSCDECKDESNASHGPAGSMAMYHTQPFFREVQRSAARSDWDKLLEQEGAKSKDDKGENERGSDDRALRKKKPKWSRPFKVR